MELPADFLNEMREIMPDYEGFIYSLSRSPARAFRVNNIKTDDEKLLSAMSDKPFSPVTFSPHCYYIGDEKWGNHAYHRAGLMYFQEPSAMAPVNAFDFHARLALDMCAAPGGKTIMLAARSDSLVSNEINPSRAAILKSNVERMGLKNVAVTNHSPKELEELGEVFDLVLVDAPCSGEGMFRKDEDAIREWSRENSKSCAIRQRAILESADKVLCKDGILIYSTCTFSRRENEDVITDFLGKFDYELISPLPCIMECTTHLTHPFMRRFYPHLSEGEGQFFCSLKKLSGGRRTLKPVKLSFDKSVAAFLRATIGRNIDYCKYGDIFYVPALNVNLPLKKIVSGGVRIGVGGKNFKPDHYFFSAYGNEMQSYELSQDQAVKYLHGEELTGENTGYLVATVLGAPLGGIKGSEGRYKNLYPKGLRI